MGVLSMRKIQTNYTKSPVKTLAAMGDSLTFATALGVPAHLYWPEVLAASLRSLEAPLKARLFGVGGSTSLEMLERQASMTQFDVPALGILFAGHNDFFLNGTLAAGSGNAGRTITVCLRPANGANNAAVVGAAVAFISWNGGANKATGVSVTAQTATTITVSTASGDNLPSGSTAVTVRLDTKANIASMTDFLFAAGCPKVVVCSTHFQNFNGGGDNSPGNVPYPTPQAGLRLELWNAQRAAALEQAAAQPGKIAFCDLYSAMYRVLTNANNPFHQANKAGVDAFWHVAAANPHLNSLGNQIVAHALLTTLQSQTGWMGDLKS
jgi:lysophospholipase L1-like esterase